MSEETQEIGSLAVASCSAPSFDSFWKDHDGGTAKEAPCITAWRKATRRLWKMHNRADDRFQKILGESPRRPWHKQRLARASDEWERTLDAIPMPPAEEAEKWESERDQEVTAFVYGQPKDEALPNAQDQGRPQNT